MTAKSICTTCKSMKVIVWTDYVFNSANNNYGYKNDLSIKLCGDCLLIHMPKECKNMKICDSCGDKFLSDKEWKKNCISCWLKNK